MSQNTHLFTYFDAKQNRRKRLAVQRKRMAAALPASVPLKTMLLNREQGKAISVAQAIPDTEPGNRGVESKGFALLTSFGLHLVGAMIGTLLIVQAPTVDDDAVIVELTNIQQAPKKRRMRPKRMLVFADRKASNLF